MKSLKKERWTQEEYLEYVTYLKENADARYKQFHSKLTTTKYEILGVRLPIQRRIAKEISKGDIPSFLECVQSEFYEEVMIEGLVLASIKEKETFLNYLEDYVSKIDNWAICDSFCNSLKIIREDKAYWLSYFSSYLKSREEFTVRVGLIVFLNFYVEKEYLEQIFSYIDQIELDKYYVNMGIAWLLCECFIKFREETLTYLQKTQVNAFTFNKTISKIRDSYRVSTEDKEYLQSLKRKEKE